MRALKPRVGLRMAVALTAAIGSLASASGALADNPSPSGAFVIGDQNAAVGTTVTFWGAQWWMDNALSGGLAPASFKGFADNATAVCGQQWTTRPGNSSAPPPSVLGVVPMVVASNVTKSGSVITGDTAEVVSVAVDPGYQPDPGHPGTGIVVAVLCGGGGGIPT